MPRKTTLHIPEQIQKLIQPVQSFLLCATPEAWLLAAARPEQRQTLLVDHCNCELKAAQTAIVMMRRYALTDESSEEVKNWTKSYEEYVYLLRGTGYAPNKKALLQSELTVKDDTELCRDLVRKMIALIKEELQHFEQVVSLMQQQGVEYVRLSASRYAGQLIKQVRTYEPAAFVDKLIIGAIIEARSCERFALLAPRLNTEMGQFYFRLLKSEARHFQDYLTLAKQVASDDDRLAQTFAARVQQLLECEAQLIQSTDSHFRFHSGIPSNA